MHWIDAQFGVYMSLEPTDKSLNMLKFCRTDLRKQKNRRRSNRASLLRNPFTIHKIQFGLVMKLRALTLAPFSAPAWPFSFSSLFFSSASFTLSCSNFHCFIEFGLMKGFGAEGSSLSSSESSPAEVSLPPFGDLLLGAVKKLKMYRTGTRTKNGSSVMARFKRKRQ